MAIPNNYIDKITDKGKNESRLICPAAENVRVENENFEADNLDEVLDEMQRAIDEAASSGSDDPVNRFDEVLLNIQDELQGFTPVEISSRLDVSSGTPTPYINVNTTYDDGEYERPYNVRLPLVQNGVIALVGDIPTRTSDLTNDSGFLTQHQDISGKADKTVIITDIAEVPAVSGTTNSATLTANTFYNIASWDRSSGSDTSYTFAFDPTLGIYAGRFTAWADNMNITWPAGVTTPDSVDATIVNGHTYEFNVWQGVLILVDVTSTEQGGE